MQTVNRDLCISPRNAFLSNFLFFCKICIWLLLLPLCVYASPLENPGSASTLDEGFFIKDTFWLNLRTKIEYVSSPNEMLSFKNGHKYGLHNSRFKSESASAILTINIKERADIYGSCGIMEKKGSFTDPNVIKFQSKRSPCWSIGTRITPIIIKNTILGVDARCSYFNGDLSHLKKRSELAYSEYQISGGIAQIIKLFVPYAGLVWRNVKAEIKHYSHKSLKINERHLWGAALGCAFKIGSSTVFSLEMRGFSETSFTASLEARF
jgi:hypothetical protein